MALFRRVAPALVVLAVLAFAAAAAADVSFTATEGQSFTKKVADTGACGLNSAQITWGDGTAASAGTSDGSNGIIGTHTYAHAGTYNGSVSYTCTQFGGTWAASFQATVQDAALSAAGLDLSGTGGQALTAVVAHLDDANPGATASDFSAQVAWGDGSTSAGSVAAAPGGGFDVSGTHTYGAAGSFTVNTSISDVGGATAAASSSADIAAPPPPRPRNTDAPVVSGEAREREPLTTSSGNWSASPTSYQYQWMRCTKAGDGCVDVPGATAAAYVPVQADVGSTLRARVRATNAVGTSLPADSAPTAVVAPLVVRARFTISPRPSCTGLTTKLDASASKTPDPPITRYKFTESIVPDLGNPRAGHQYDVADGPSPRASYIFSWTRTLGSIIPSIKNYKIFIAEPRIVTLTVTDRAGATASYSQELDFAQLLSSEPRSLCPKQRARRNRFGSTGPRTFTVHKRSLTATLSCVTAAECTGALRIRTNRHGKPVTIATNPFFSVAAHRSAVIKAKLTAVGRALVSRHKPLVATEKLTTISATGQMTTDSRRITLQP